MPNTPADIVKQTATTSLSSWCVFRWSKHICGLISWRFFLSFSAVILCLPPFAYGWLPGSGNPTATNGFVVDTSNRRDVLAFYQTIYNASEGYLARIGWTGDVSSGIAGTTSDLFKADVLRRINFYRALVGLPADITLNSVKSSKDQDNALWISANRYLTHYPTGGYFYKATVADAASHSNLAWGVFGPGAIDGYMDDSGVSSAGHRRWIIYSLAAEMGTGDIPENSSGRAANALWVIGDAKSSSAKKFVPWPNAGFTPINFVHSTWSVSYPGANFSSARITVTQRGSGVSHQYSGWVSDGAGDNALMWTPSEVPSSISADTTFDINISGIGGQGVPSSYTYSVTLFDPAVLGDSISIYGNTAPPTTGASYSFSSVEQADQYELRVYSSSSSTATEGAESSPTPKVQLITTGSYSVIQSATKLSGSKAFHLAFPDFNDQVFEISRDFIPSATSYLKFYDLGRFASTSTTLNAEVSTDNGLTWQTIWSRFGVGLSSSSFDSQFNTRSVSLSTYAGKPIRVRFALRRNGSSVVVNTGDNCGFFLDDISVTNSTELVDAVSTILSGTTTDFSLNSTTAGGALVAGAPHYMRIRPMVGGQWFDFGALKTVFPTQSLSPTITSQPASLAVNVGSPASFSVTATGTGSLSCQWRKDGANIAGGTSSTYVIASAQTTDAGSYSVVVSNAAGSVTSASASLTVNKVTPVITILPTASPIMSGQSLTASVLSGGSASVAGIFAFTSPSTVPSVGTTSQSVTFTPTDSSRYTPVSTALSVTVNSAVGRIPVITSATTATGTVGSAFNYQIAGTNTPSSYTATGLPAGLTVNSVTGLISGMPSIVGQSVVTLGALNSGGTGSATLTVSILAAGTGGTGTVSWTDLVGTYEGLLEQNPDSPTDDMAVYRGAFSLTFSRTGTVSGRVFYNEATALDGSQNRVYVPVIRTFVGLLTASSANSLTYQKVIRLGTGTSLGRQELTLDVSFEETPPRLSVTVKDTASPSAGEDAWVSQALSCSRSLTKLPASTSVGGGTLDYSKAVGRYTLSATDGDPTGVNNAYVLAQLLSTGKVLWTSRMKGTLGTGSTGLRVTSDGLNASFYEGRVSSTSASLKSTSVLGSLNFVCTSGSWSSNFGSEPLPGKVERQASYVSKTGGKLAFNDAQDSTGVTGLDFSSQDGVRWGNTTVTTVPAFLSGSALSSSTFTLSAQDPLTDSGGNTVSYAWNVSVASTGKILTTSTTEETGVLSPRLLMTLNRQNGEFVGYYMSSISGKSVRRNIYGCGLISDVDGTLRARGWVESGVLPTLSTGGWTLQLGP